MNIKSLIISILIILFVGLGTLLLIKNRYQPSPDVNTQSPDLIILNSKMTTYTKQGQIKSILQAKQSMHYTEHDSTLLTQPYLIIYTQTRHKWLIQADHGKFLDGTKRVTLWGNVILREPKQTNIPETIIRTSKLTYYPDRSFAKTKQDVIIMRPDAKLQSHGMAVDLKKGILVTQSRTQGTFNEIKQ